MKAWTFIWGIMAAICLIAVLSGATHHILTLGISAAMCLALRADDTDEEESHE